MLCRMLRLCAADKLTSLLRAVVETLEPLAGAQACKQPYAAAMEDSMASLGEAVVVSRRLIAELAELQQQGGEVGGRGGGGLQARHPPVVDIISHRPSFCGDRRREAAPRRARRGQGRVLAAARWAPSRQCWPRVSG